MLDVLKLDAVDDYAVGVVFFLEQQLVTDLATGLEIDLVTGAETELDVDLGFNLWADNGMRSGRDRDLETFLDTGTDSWVRLS